MGRWDGTLLYLDGDRPGLMRIGRLVVIAVVIMVIAIGVSLALGGGDDEGPVIDNSTGLYEEGPTSWGLCGAFTVMAVVLLMAIVIEIKS